MRYRARDGSLLHVDEHGAGRPLVVVPGEPDRHPSYLRCFDTVAGTRRILVLHPRGRGGSEAVPAGSAATTADDLEDLRTHLGVDDLDLVAHDSGCRAALLAAARAPGSVAHLLLIAPGTAWLGIDADHPAQEHDGQEPPAPPAEAAALREALGRLTCAAVVVGGGDDPLTDLAALGALTGLLPHGSLAVVEASGHHPWADAPAEFSIALRASLVVPAPAPPLGRRRPPRGTA
ncbi:pimeloyl-ACP methyl ester carboxylesterase [Rathayibacter tanaceti]|uniref:Alpha/beta fold hydrolase n=2 Tax=Rathayibacter tanaceti TaxID=1671680 RepID=A0AAE6RHK6_9MICO|nr:alpha/beta hydrolase [Rathayibacter tanaceti]QHC54242.1 alpha/beta fold hydrolase [Rathayibacter tanaceti]TCO37918.1 pimeloyl-ACP methyl ester carboxylesterase [Rathayibacter tanaceti]